MEYNGLIINHFAHDCFQIKAGSKVIYIDPYTLKSGQIEPADYIFVTHGHFDHCSRHDLEKITGQQTIIVASKECQVQLSGLKVKEIVYVGPDQFLELESIKVETVQAYNLDKFRENNQLYHSPEGDELGFILEISGLRLYHSGDTDKIPEMARLKNIDLALLPVSGTYVMTVEEAVEAAKVIKPKVAIPMHYGSVVGSLADAQKFKDLLAEENINVQII